MGTKTWAGDDTAPAESMKKCKSSLFGASQRTRPTNTSKDFVGEAITRKFRFASGDWVWLLFCNWTALESVQTLQDMPRFADFVEELASEDEVWEHDGSSFVLSPTIENIENVLKPRREKKHGIALRWSLRWQPLKPSKLRNHGEGKRSFLRRKLPKATRLTGWKVFGGALGSFAALEGRQSPLLHVLKWNHVCMKCLSLFCVIAIACHRTSSLWLISFPTLHTPKTMEWQGKWEHYKLCRWHYISHLLPQCLQSHQLATGYPSAVRISISTTYHPPASKDNRYLQSLETNETSKVLVLLPLVRLHEHGDNLWPKRWSPSRPMCGSQISTTSGSFFAFYTVVLKQVFCCLRLHMVYGFSFCSFPRNLRIKVVCNFGVAILYKNIQKQSWVCSKRVSQIDFVSPRWTEGTSVRRCSQDTAKVDVQWNHQPGLQPETDTFADSKSSP